MSSSTSPLSTILVVDDEKNIRRTIEISLSQSNHRVLLAHDLAAAYRYLQDEIVDMMILDIELGDVSGISFFQRLADQGIHIPTLFISGRASLSQAAQSIKLGAYDFLEKPFSAEKLQVTVQRCLELSRLESRLTCLEKNKSNLEMIGESSALKKLKLDIHKVAQTNACVHIFGESGTGKELVANALHDLSTRSSSNFIKVNCSAIPENLIESELFGFEKGSFTSAHASKKGYFEMAHRGTIFLDEIADLSLSAQSKLLRVLQSGEIQKIGFDKTMKVDVRIISATHKNLGQLVSEGLFREDLFYRLNVIPLNVPSLRQRKEDIPLLIAYFAEQSVLKNNLQNKKISPEVYEELQKYSWPGNIRQLQNVIERMMILSGPILRFEDLPEDIIHTQDEDLNSLKTDLARNSTLKEFRDEAEKKHILFHLKQNQGNISKTAQELGVGRTYLHKRLGVLQIMKKDYFV